MCVWSDERHGRLDAWLSVQWGGLPKSKIARKVTCVLEASLLHHNTCKSAVNQHVRTTHKHTHKLYSE